jgi:putative component of toxin-antitoxin plasmid stabilization module
MKLPTVVYISVVPEVITSNLFDEWLAALRDRIAKTRILVRI